MNTNFLLLALVASIAVVNCAIVFTGNVGDDFNPSNPLISEEEKYGLFIADSGTTINPSPYMEGLGRRSGLDIDFIRTYYDWKTDSLYVGIQCAGICGDNDGNGDAGTSDSEAGVYFRPDPSNYCENEAFSLMFWNNVPEDYTPSDPVFFFPNFIIGKPYPGCIVDADGTSHFVAYEFPGYKDCMWPIPRDDVENVCVTDQITRVSGPAENGVGYNNQKILSVMNPLIPPPKVFSLYPNITHPHWEFVLQNFTLYPEMSSFKPGVSRQLRIGISAVSANNADNAGEDFVDPQIWQIDYDCAFIADGPTKVDNCSKCGGDNTTCDDCFGVPHGPADYDDCGVCGGHGETCRCVHYLGYDLEAVDYALLRWTISASLLKINDTLAVLRQIRRGLPHYDYETGKVALNDYIDTIHDFCDDCLDSFDNAQLWFAEYLNGAYDGIDLGQKETRWTL